MNFRESYDSIGADYDTFLRRMNGKETLVEKYIKMFLVDGTYSELEQAMATGDVAGTEIKAHTLKGIALNLSLEKLSIQCNDMVNSIRNGNIQELDTQFQAVRDEYELIIKNLGS